MERKSLPEKECLLVHVYVTDVKDKLFELIQLGGSSSVVPEYDHSRDIIASRGEVTSN